MYVRVRVYQLTYNKLNFPKKKKTKQNKMVSAEMYSYCSASNLEE